MPPGKGYEADTEGLKAIHNGLQAVEKEMRTTAVEVIREAEGVPADAFGKLPVSDRVAKAHMLCAKEVAESANQSGDELVSLETKVSNTGKGYEVVEVDGVKMFRAATS
jgi:hypothetical protein